MSEQRATLRPTVAIVGGGPAGLTAATTLRRLGIESVLVLEREQQAGGIPRNSDHTGYGVRDLRTVLTGPAYAERLVRQARDWRVDIRTASTVTDWADDRSLMVTSPEGRLRVDAQAVVLATGARERPRSARMVPGDRPSGVLTTGQLQNLVHGRHERSGGQVGVRAVVVGAELVSWSAVLTLREAGCATAMMTTEHQRAESYAAFTIPGRSLLRVPVSRRTRVTRIVGRERVEAVEVTRLDSGQSMTVPCDTVVFTGDWIPDGELARLRGLDMDRGAGLRWWTPHCAPASTACSRRATCCTRSTRPTSPRWTAGMWPHRCWRTWLLLPGRWRARGSWRGRASRGSPRGSCASATRRRHGRVCCCGRPRTDRSLGWWCARTTLSSRVACCRGPRRRAGSSACRGGCSTRSIRRAATSRSAWPDLVPAPPTLTAWPSTAAAPPEPRASGGAGWAAWSTT